MVFSPFVPVSCSPDPTFLLRTSSSTIASRSIRPSSHSGRFLDLPSSLECVRVRRTGLETRRPPSFQKRSPAPGRSRPEPPRLGRGRSARPPGHYGPRWADGVVSIPHELLSLGVRQQGGRPPLQVVSRRRQPHAPFEPEVCLCPVDVETVRTVLSFSEAHIAEHTPHRYFTSNRSESLFFCRRYRMLTT